ncbi:Transposase [Nitrosomonas cryotolerans]|uniref:Transposase n=1 Tax=Nitrosomonas cryotolerans ATCC 49181 TaxID=1131553 RepID=A0A1N6G8M6_9PROT|nr:Transposase [Nitrosomonas cryotolerans]SIO03883.1 Transposase [Nitrosomonas cryotolerans ATCC 49181]
MNFSTIGVFQKPHNVLDEVWALLKTHLPVCQGVGGGAAKDNYRFINAIFWIIRTGTPWRGLPPGYGGWSDTHRRFIRWCDKGIWEKLLEILIDDPDYEWLMIDANHCKVHPHAAGARGENQMYRSLRTNILRLFQKSPPEV